MEYLRLLILRSWDRRHNSRHYQLSMAGEQLAVPRSRLAHSICSVPAFPGVGRQLATEGAGLTGKRTTGRTRQQRSSMQRNSEHELDPKNTERCRVVPEAVSLSLPETSQLLPRRTPIEDFQSWTTAKRGLGVFYATCFRVPKSKSRARLMVVIW